MAKAPKFVIVAPIAGIVYVTGERPAHEIVIGSETETVVTHKYDARVAGFGPVRVAETKTRKVKTKVDKTEFFTREFTAGEAVLTPNKVGMAVAEALKMHEAGLKNVRLYTLDGTFFKKFTATDAKKAKAATEETARFVRREEKFGMLPEVTETRKAA